MKVLSAVQNKGPEKSIQQNLNQLDEVLGVRESLFLLLRINTAIFAITFIPYQAPDYERELYVQSRDVFVKSFGEQHFKATLICKEVGEITDTRSWIERGALQQEDRAIADSNEHPSVTTDEGYKKTKCRLCDRRMKNKITDEAFEALSNLEREGECVQLVSIPKYETFLLH